MTALLGDERFRELTGVGPDALESVAEGDRAVFLPKLLTPAHERPPEGCPDGMLLMARHAVVPFLGRDEELDELRSWAAEPDPLSIAVITGRSGTGKTRLAVQLCAELAQAGWDTGFLPLDPVHDLLSGPAGPEVVELDALRETLVVVDRPEPSYPMVGELIRRLAKHGRNPRVRLLFLVREPGEAEGWRRLDTASGGWLRRLTTTTVQLNIRPLTLPERTEHALAAMRAFAPDRADLPDPPRLDDPVYGLPFHVHLAALLRVRDGDPAEGAGGGLLGRFVARELDRWIRAERDDSAQEDTRQDESRSPDEEILREDAPREPVRQAVAALALTAPASAELAGLPAVVPGVPHEGGRLRAFGPELVVGELLAGTEGLERLVLALHDREGRTVEQLIHMIDVLLLTSGREPVGAALRALVTGRIAELVGEAVAHPGTRLGDVLDAALALVAADPGPAAIVSAGVPMPRRGVGLGLRALNVTLADLAVRHRRAHGDRIALAGALTWSSSALASVGRLGEAVAAATEAVESYAGAPPYEAAAGRADALFGLGACLLLAGAGADALKPAQEAAARFRILAEEDPRYSGEAARAHHNLACALLEAGRVGNAVAAFEAAGGDPDFAAHVAAVLSVLDADVPPGATAFAAPEPSHAAGRGPSAFSGIEASRAAGPRMAEIWRVPGPVTAFEEVKAVEVLPEVAGCLGVAATEAVRAAASTSSDVAHRLHLIATRLDAYGRPRDALVPAAEAVARLRGLADAEPGLRAMLASAASALAGVQARLDDLDAAARSAAECVRNLRALVTLEPAEHRPALAAGLLDLGELLLADDRPEEALAPLQEAMTVAADGGAARARRLLGLCLDELGRTADARAQLEIAAELYDVPGAGHLVRGQDGSAEVRARLSRMEPAEPETGEPWLPGLTVTPPQEAVARAEERLAECRRAVEDAGAPGPELVDAYLSAQAVLATAWADAGRAGDGLALATQAAELLQRHAAPGPPHAIAVGMVAAALGRALVGLGRHKEAVPHLLTAIESYEPQAELSVAFRTELAHLLTLETVALSRAACPADAEAAADRLVELYAALVGEGAEPPPALAGALRLQAGIRFARQDAEGALRSVTRALDAVPSPPGDDDARLLTAACLELGGLCLAELGDAQAAGDRLARGTALMARVGTVPGDLIGVHLLALVRLARLRAREEGPAAGAALYARILDMRPLPGADVLGTLVDELSGLVAEMTGTAGLAGPLAAFAEALERDVPLGGAPELHARYARCLAAFGAAAARDGDDEGAVLGAELAVRVYRGLAVVSGAYREPLGVALAELAAVYALSGRVELAVLEQAVGLLGGRPDRTFAEALLGYAAELLERGRAVEALAHCERAADLCDELDDPSVAAAVYAQLGATLAALDRPQAALEAITWSLAELDRADQDRPEQDRPEQDRPEQDRMEPARVRARAIQVRGTVLRAFGREQVAMAHLVEALRLFTALPDPQAAAETAAMIADDLLAAGRPREAAEYAGIAATGHRPGTVKHALATQRLVRCHMMLGALIEANALVENLIRTARRDPDDLTYRAVLADSLAQSSELLPLLRLDGAVEAETRAREAIAIYDELIATGTDQQALHTGRAGACLTLASALRMRDLAAEAISPLREAVAELEQFSPGNPMQGGLLSRAMLMLGDALMEADRPLEAGLVFHRATQVTRDAPARAVAHARLGFCQLDLGRDDAADAALRVSADLLRALPAARQDGDLLRDVLRGRFRLLEKAGRDQEARAVEAELLRLGATP
ncbi:tetratricopeptide repeat protein [Nonomuraea terrae]|uniref:tetratricopeptide repeat protein n=1 Tax=Nonomuraea terrae TaxID=2530383 RepID=UPI001404E382|nr:tetratricopeptide repeat protein [Nonomuraea terrae]